MFFSKITVASALLLGLAAASPVEKRDFDAQVTFLRLDGTSYTVSAPADSARAGPVLISDPSDVTVASFLGGATCSIKGTEGAEVTLVSKDVPAQIAPAQPIYSVYCIQL